MSKFSRPITALTALAVFWMFALPKAGFYLAGTPVTFGYFMLAALAALQVLRMTTRPLRVCGDHLTLGLLLCSLGTIELTTFARYGYDSIGSLASIVVSSLLMPVLSILAAHWTIERLGLPRLLKVVGYSLLVVAGYGLLSFLVFNTAGVLVGIPYITTTGGDLSEIMLRHNLRGPVIKMFSTYNNGNVLGVNVLLWGPLVATSLQTQMAFRTVCLLTLSRSVWVGLLVYESLTAAISMKIWRWFAGLVLLGMLIASVYGASRWMGLDPLAFLTDRQLGGRVQSIQNNLHRGLSSQTNWPSESFYASAYLSFGPAGLVLMTLVLLFPIVRGGRSNLAIRGRIAMATYLVVASAESAYNLVPTQMSYWFVAAIACHPATCPSVSPNMAVELNRRASGPALAS